MVMMDTANLESASEKRTERINSIIALVIVVILSIYKMFNS